MATTEVIPQTADELTPAWFSEHLGAHVGGATVVEVVHEEIGTGIGFVGEIYRCTLTADVLEPGMPTSVIVKVPARNPVNRAMGEALGAYEREIQVYGRLGNRLGIPMPRLYHCNLDPNPAPWLDRPLLWLLEHLPIRGVGWLGDRFVALSAKSSRRYLLVIEDIADARPPTQVQGGSLDDALVALDVLARFHAANWRTADADVDLDRVWSIGRVPRVFQSSFRRNRELFVERFGAVAGPDVIELLDRVQAELPEMLAHLASPPTVLLHGDYRLDNLLFRPDGSVVVVDYQLVGTGRPGWDVAYFITTALTAEHRSEEEQMLHHYHSALVDAGVADHSYEELAIDVMLTKRVLAHRFVGTVDGFDTTVAGGDESFVDLMVGRVMDWVRP
jgi:Ecdysteroid kinase-like family